LSSRARYNSIESSINVLLGRQSFDIGRQSKEAIISVYLCGRGIYGVFGDLLAQSSFKMLLRWQSVDCAFGAKLSSRVSRCSFVGRVSNVYLVANLSS
jgi:hypothetical protein